MASYGGLQGIVTGLTKSTDHPSGHHQAHKSEGMENWGVSGALHAQRFQCFQCEDCSIHPRGL